MMSWRTGAILLLIGACLVPVFVNAQGSGADRSLTARLQRLEDIEEIRLLLLDYGRTLDARDFGGYSRLFAKDGIWTGGLGTVQGSAAIQAFMEKNIGTAPNRANNYHLLSNFVIDVQGDKATAWSRWAFVVPGPDAKPVIAQAGHYDDTLIRENGRWRFQRRVAASDLTSLKAEGSSLK